jgi:hypothetical protein
VALVAFDGRVYPNEARPLERLGIEQRTRPLEEAIEQWFSFATGKQTWISVHGATIRGLISARPRAKRTVWEVEVLIDASGQEGTVPELVSRMTAGVLKQGGQRVFLRLAEDSCVADAALRGGFFRYASETLYCRPAAGAIAAMDAPPLEPRTAADGLHLYRLYNALTPATVRAIEGATPKEWQAAQEKWGGRSSEFVVRDGSVTTGWVRVVRGSIGRVGAMSADGRYLDLVEAALGQLRGRDIYCLVPEYNHGLASAVMELGFEPAGRYSAMARRLARPVQELATEQTSEAVPAG